MHNPVFEQSDILSFALLDCIILHVNGKQFRCSVFTFIQYITNTGITDLNDIEFLSQPLHIILKDFRNAPAAKMLIYCQNVIF